ncbi:MAG TPA: WD40 repeat domain-containing protein, partial [Aggregatilineales bacterium]|nr:WD40 repeat domain-containing protein [Aggregatilineales bacterium]
YGKTISLNPPGSELAIANQNGIQLYGTETGQLLHSISDPLAGVWQVSFSPDGSILASIDARGHVRIIDPSSGAILHELTFINGNGLVWWPLSLTGVQFSGDGSRLIAWAWMDKDYPLQVWDTKNWSLVTTIANQYPGAISPDGKRLAVTNDVEESLAVLDTATQTLLFKAQDSERSSYFSFSPNGNYLLAVDWMDAEVTVWDAATGKKLQRINRNAQRDELPMDANFRFALSRDGTKLATIQYYDELNIWNAQTWTLLQNIPLGRRIDDVTINDNGTVLAAFSGQVVYFLYLPPSGR